MTTSTELRQYYSRCVYCKMLCPIWDCSTVHIPEGQDLVNGEEYTFVIKPDKTLLCCVPLPLISVMIAPCCCTSFDIHSVSSDGQLRVSRYGVCFSRDKVYEDVAGMDSFDRCGESNRLYNFKYRYLDGSFGIALNSNYSNVEIGDKQQIMEAVEGFFETQKKGRWWAGTYPFGSNGSFNIWRFCGYVNGTAERCITEQHPRTVRTVNGKK
eukprot:gb/GECG01013963.1/.p1 GENE.gb/GECG01013963.1/~~gb/GECG01013963.1/.p1  ORF type:complete len:211 (+),score=13.64 gb/GECG01013963.1/:1-633(+)